MAVGVKSNVSLAQLQMLAVFVITLISFFLVYRFNIKSRWISGDQLQNQLERVVGSRVGFDSGKGADTNEVDFSSESEPYVDFELDQKFDDMCGEFWKERVAHWSEKIRKKKPTESPLHAIQRRSGAGDRMSGTVTALMTSMQKGKRLLVNWKNLDGAFTTSTKLTELAKEHNHSLPLVEISGSPGRMPSRACYQRSFYECSALTHMQDHCPVYLRACVGSQSCNSLKAIHENNLRMSHVLGCTFRMIMSPTMELMHHEISWFMDGNIVNGTVLELAEELKKFHVVSIHIRRGDGAFKGGSESRLKPMERDLTKCAKQVDRETLKSVNSTTGKMIKWFMASDDPNLKEYFRSEFPDKMVELLFKPHHLDYIKRIKGKNAEREELKNLFSEWYILGRGNELITNNAHPHFGVSSFSRTAWLYNLKSDFYILKDYDRKFCVRRGFKYKGNVNRVHKNCHAEDE